MLPTKEPNVANPLDAPHVDGADLDIRDVAGGAEAVDGDVCWTHMDRFRGIVVYPAYARWITYGRPDI